MFVEFPAPDARARAELAERPPASAHLRTAVWRARDLWLSVAFAIGAFFAIAFTLGALDATITLDGDRLDVALAVATMLLEVSLGLWVLLRARVRGLRLGQLGFRLPDRWGPLWVAWAGSYLILIGYIGVLSLLDGLGVDVERFTEGNQLPIEPGEQRLVLVLLGVSVVALAPLCEELFFRGLLFRGIRGYWPLLPALAVSGLLFGAFHQNLSVLVPFTLIGMLFAWANEQSRSLWTSVAAHGAVNSLSYVLSIAGVAA